MAAWWRRRGGVVLRRDRREFTCVSRADCAAPTGRRTPQESTPCPVGRDKTSESMVVTVGQQRGFIDSDHGARPDPGFPSHDRIHTHRVVDSGYLAAPGRVGVNHLRFKGQHRLCCRPLRSPAGRVDVTGQRQATDMIGEVTSQWCAGHDRSATVWIVSARSRVPPPDSRSHSTTFSMMSAKTGDQWAKMHGWHRERYGDRLECASRSQPTTIS